MPKESPTIIPEIYDDSGSDGYYDGGSTDVTKTCKLVVKYYVNGAAGSPPSTVTKTYRGVDKGVALSVTVAKKTDSMVKEGYIFLGWATSSSATKAGYKPGNKIKKTWLVGQSGTTTYNLYAVWKQGNGFIYRPDEYSEEYGYDQYEEAPLNQPTTLAESIFTREGYTITGWSLEDGTHVGDAGASYTLTSSGWTVLYPEWTANSYTLTFRPVFGSSASGEILTMTATYDSEILIPDSDTYTKANYHLDHWNEDRWDQASSWFPGKTYLFKRTEDITLYAIWKGVKYYVIYDEEDNQNGLEISKLLSLVDEDNSDLIEFLNQLNVDRIQILDLLTSIGNSGFDVSSTLRLFGINYGIATYGDEFYTEYRPPFKENYTFAGWETSSGDLLVKSDHCMDSYTFGSDPIWSGTSNVVLHPVWSGNYPFGKIFYGRKESSDYGIIVENPPEYYYPEKDYTLKEVKGKNGSVLIDQNRYANVEKKYNVAVYSKDGFTTASRNLTDFLHRYDGYSDYIRLEDTYEPDVYMLGVCKEKNEITNLLGQAGRAEITFDCKPQKYLLSGSTEIQLVEMDTSINNPTDYPALPIIRVSGTGLIKFYMRPERAYLGQSGSKLVTAYFYINTNFNEIVLDCEKLTIVDKNGRNMNPYVSLTRTIVLYPGLTGIKCEGDIEKVSIIPRWWRL